jgi:hypothetical protein
MRSIDVMSHARAYRHARPLYFFVRLRPARAHRLVVDFVHPTD